MAENVPPPSSIANGVGVGGGGSSVADQTSANRGIPYYEKLRRDLRDTLQKKRLLDKNMASLEESIYRFEQSYLEETGAGNIIKGFDNYIKGASTTSGIGSGSTLGMVSNITVGAAGGGPTTRRKAQVADMDRVFSRSSVGFMRDSPAPSSANTTPSHAPTPSSTGPGSNKDSTSGGTGSGTNAVKGTTTKKHKKAAGVSSSAGEMKGRGKDDDDDGDPGAKQPAKRLKITYGRD